MSCPQSSCCALKEVMTLKACARLPARADAPLWRSSYQNECRSPTRCSKHNRTGCRPQTLCAVAQHQATALLSLRDQHVILRGHKSQAKVELRAMAVASFFWSQYGGWGQHQRHLQSMALQGRQLSILKERHKVCHVLCMRQKCLFRT